MVRVGCSQPSYESRGSWPSPLSHYSTNVMNPAKITYYVYACTAGFPRETIGKDLVRFVRDDCSNWLQ